MIRTYSLKIDGNKKLSEHFSVKEFRCKDGSDKILISDELVTLLEQIRTYFGKPVRINSAYRNSTYNKKVGGASGSQHVKGTAADIVVSDVPPSAVAAWAEQYNSGGNGHYSTFTHVDVRGYKVLWLGSNSSNSVSSFRLGNIHEKYKAKKMTTSKPVTTAETEVEKTQPAIEKEVKEVTYNEWKKFQKQYEVEKKAEAMSDYAASALSWAAKEGLLKGDEKGNLMPKSYLTREDMAVILQRFAEAQESDV